MELANDPGRFIISPNFSRIFKKYGEDVILRNLHQSLNIEDRITALIRKQKLLSFPAGTSLAGRFS